MIVDQPQLMLTVCRKKQPVRNTLETDEGGLEWLHENIFFVQIRRRNLISIAEFGIRSQRGLRCHNHDKAVQAMIMDQEK